MALGGAKGNYGKGVTRFIPTLTNITSFCLRYFPLECPQKYFYTKMFGFGLLEVIKCYFKYSQIFFPKKNEVAHKN